MEYKTIKSHIGDKILECETCGYKNKFDATGIKIPFDEIDGGILKTEDDGSIQFGYPIWANFDCYGCGKYIGYAFIEHIRVEFE